ncbi:hypothetical protein [Pyrococcus horikoshii]|uniref:Uncharacterized protein n=1 Tax=Pyrococcus horikoshii (strain ATCC 700860 / DSM 12428 / JCM 9974 / NBRC 100139 / OT-3) TaxID=70601 RepID=O58915_PYRHO|nr:hypothetical protein [Pyrococcus horikoshii]BAA30281.1 143aa long hypothetical protein [Pyrococcus horikoshii OT3]
MVPKLILKGIWSGIISFLLLIFLTIYGPLEKLSPSSQFYWTMASISGALAGFVLVGMTILHTLPDIQVYRELQKFKSFSQIYTIYHFTFVFLLIVLVLSVIGGTSLSEDVFFGYFVFALFWISLWLVYSCFWILKKLAELRFS